MKQSVAPRYRAIASIKEETHLGLHCSFSLLIYRRVGNSGSTKKNITKEKRDDLLLEKREKHYVKAGE